MRILVVLSRVPWPLEKGDKLRAYHVIRELSKHHEILLFCLSDAHVDPQAEAQLKAFCSEIHIQRFSRRGTLWRTFLGLFVKRPFQVSYFYSKSAQLQFDKFVDKHLPDHIFCQLVRTAEYARRYRVIPKSIDYMDALAAGMERMSNTARWPISWGMRIEQRRLQAYEKAVYPHFQHHFIISDQDKKHLGVPGPVDVVPNGINPEFLNGFEPVPAKYDVLFSGNMNYRPNVESARFLVKQIMPFVWKALPDCRVALAGATPAAAVRALAEDRVIVTGWVDDIAAIYRASRVFVAPMLINSGLQNKLLEAMACSLPCITTPLANNALGAAPGREIECSADAEEIAHKIVALLQDPARSQELGKAGHDFVQKSFSWEHAVGIIHRKVLTS